mmetsp:Transcript_11300/g.16726  ORF Transcript_11300/g.16726 Transcript_11300/m.16726 type:complete len:203 (+) Transcript_11300:17-625(+)
MNYKIYPHCHIQKFTADEEKGYKMSWEEILLQLSLSSDADEESYISESSTGKFLSGFNNEGSQIDVSLFSTTRQLIRFFPRVMQIEPTSINSMYPYALRIAHQLGECKIATESLEQQQQIIQDLHYLKYMDTEQERTLREPPAVSPIKNLSPPHPSSTGTSPFKEPMNETSTQTDKKPKKKRPIESTYRESTSIKRPIDAAY